MYTDLKTFQNAAIIQDFTFEFVKRYIPPGSRTRDQMEQATRSGKQNIAEAVANAKQKPKSERMLLGVASASLKEALEDYQDYLRQHGLRQWPKDDSRALKARNLYKTYPSYRTYLENRSYRSHPSDQTDKTDKTDSATTDEPAFAAWVKLALKVYLPYLENPESACNAMICLINQTTFLLDNQIGAVERQQRESGAIFESREQRLRRIMAANAKRERETDALIARVLAEGSGKKP